MLKQLFLIIINTMNWDKSIASFKVFLEFEKSLSVNTVKAYLRDVEKLNLFQEEKKYGVNPDSIKKSHIDEFIKWVNEQNLSAKSQARIIS